METAGEVHRADSGSGSGGRLRPCSDASANRTTSAPKLRPTYNLRSNVCRNKDCRLKCYLVDEIVEQWTVSQFNRNGIALREEQVNTLVTSQLLSSWFEAGGRKLEMDYLKWDGGPDSALLNYMLVCRGSPYVALVRERRLEKVVDRNGLATRVAESALSRQLS